MKKILTKNTAILLTFVLVVMTSFSAFAGSAYQMTDYADMTIGETATAYLDMMGITDGCDPKQQITRGQAVSAIIRAMGLEGVALGGNSIYTYEEKMADMAHKAGILSGNTPSQWALESPVTYEQICKMLVVALGYGSVITGDNAFPALYVSQASKLGITKYINGFNSINVSFTDFSVMRYQAMQTKALEIVGVSGESLIYSHSDERTLEALFLESQNLAKKIGIVDSDYYTCANSLYPCAISQICIDGIMYNCDSAQCKDLVGMEVEFVYTDSPSLNSRTIKGIRPTECNKVFSFNRNQDAECKNGNVNYFESNEKEKSLKLSDGMVLIYNNQICSSYNLSDIDFSKCYVKLIDNNDDNTYDVMFVKESQSVIVSHVKDEKIYIKLGDVHSKKVIALSDTDEISLIMHKVSGEAITLEDIVADSPISVVADKDFSHIEIILLEDKKEGKFEELNSQNHTVIADGKEYGLKISDSEFSLGKSYRFLSNEYDEIFYIEPIPDDCSYIVDKSYTSGGLESDAKLKVYDSELGLCVYTIADRLSVDGVTYSNLTEAMSAIKTSTLGYVNFDAEGRVKSIKYLDSYASGGQRTYCEFACGFNDMSHNTLMPFRYDEQTTFFYVPVDNDDDDFGFIVPLKDGNDYQTEAFELNEATGCAGAVVVKLDTDVRESTQLTYRSDIAIVKSVSQVIDVDLQSVYKIEAYHEGVLETFYSGHYPDVFAVCARLKAGDVISYVENYNDEIVRMSVLRSMSELDGYFLDGFGSVNEQFFGKVIVLDKNVLTNDAKYLMHQMSVSTTSDYNNLIHFNVWAYTDNPKDSSYEFADWYSYNKTTKEVALISVDDIMTYENAGSGATEMFVQRASSDLKMIVVVEER